MWKERNTRELKFMSPAAKETSSYLLLTFLSPVFFLLHWNSGSFLFFRALRAFISSFAACLWCKVTEHHNISLSTATRVSTWVCVCVRGMSRWSDLWSAVEGEHWWRSIYQACNQVPSIRDMQVFTSIANNLQHLSRWSRTTKKKKKKSPIGIQETCIIEVVSLKESMRRKQNVSSNTSSRL